MRPKTERSFLPARGGYLDFGQDDCHLRREPAVLCSEGTIRCRPRQNCIDGRARRPAVYAMLRFRFGRSRPWHKSGAERRRDALTVRGAVGGWTLSKRDKPTPESPPHRKARTTDSVDASQITTNVEVAVGISLKDLTNLYLLLSVKGFGPQKFRELHLSQIPATEALENPERLPAGGKRWDGFRSDLGGIPAEMRELCHRRAVRQILTAHKLGACPRSRWRLSGGRVHFTPPFPEARPSFF